MTAKGEIDRRVGNKGRPRKSEQRRPRAQQFLDLESTWYQRWYFELRFDEELERALRYGQPTSLVTAQLESIGEAGSEERTRLSEVLAWLANERLRITDMPGVINRDEYALFLPQTDRVGAEVVAERLKAILNDFGPRVSLAVFPDDGANAQQLLDVARANSVRTATVIDFPVARRKAQIARDKKSSRPQA